MSMLGLSPNPTDNGAGLPTPEVSTSDGGSPDDVTSRLKATRDEWQARHDAERDLAKSIRGAISSREDRIAKALANIERWTAENADDRRVAAIYESSVESQRLQLEGIDRAIAGDDRPFAAPRRGRPRKSAQS